MTRYDKQYNLRWFFRSMAKTTLYPLFRNVISSQLKSRAARFDKGSNIETMRTVSLDELGLSPERSTRYEPSPIGFFHSILRKLSIDYEKTGFIDLGAGKGRVLLLASQYPFQWIIGVEISSELCTIARANIEAHQLARGQPTPPILVVCKGIEEFNYRFDRADHVLVYLANPCGESVLRIALDRLSKLASQGRVVTIIYLNPICRALLEEASWLQEVDSGETFDETEKGGFMPYIAFRSIRPGWKKRIESLDFQFGRWVLGRWKFPALANTTSPISEQDESVPQINQAMCYHMMKDKGQIARTLSLADGMIRYVPHRDKGHFVALSSSSFEQYLAKFSRKTRGNLKRQVRHFAEDAEGSIDFRYYSSPEEMAQFCNYAVPVSRLSYQQKIGWGFYESNASEKIEEASNGRACGFLLMHKNNPASYAFCTIEGDIIIYSNIGYDPQYKELSPGTVLLFLILERLFAERRFRFLDLGGEAWGYKKLFSTGVVDYLKVLWLPMTPKNLLMVLAHLIVLQAWHAAARLKRFWSRLDS